MADSAADDNGGGFAIGTILRVWSSTEARWVICEAIGRNRFVRYDMRSKIQSDWWRWTTHDSMARVHWTHIGLAIPPQLATEQECNEHQHDRFAWMLQEMSAYRRDRDDNIDSGYDSRWIEDDHRGIVAIFREAMKRTALYNRHHGQLQQPRQ